MDSNAVAALAKATVDGQTHFGQVSRAADGPCPTLYRLPGREGAPDEKVRTRHRELPQARQTATVVGWQPKGAWGYEHGINEHQVAAGCLDLPATVRVEHPGLEGTEVIRLILERSRSARQAVDLLTNLVERYGQGAGADEPAEAACDHAFLIVDPTEAYAVETAGPYWVYQEVQEVRAVSNTRVIRQDWDRIAPGLAAYVIGRGRWADDGSKLDFAGALGDDLASQAPALRRWGRTTLLLMEQHGHLDLAFMRQLLGTPVETRPASEAHPRLRSEEEKSWHKHAPEKVGKGAVYGIIASLTQDPAGLPMIGCGIGTPYCGVSFPVFLEGDLPEALMRSAEQAQPDDLWPRLRQLSDQLERERGQRAAVQESFARLQTRFDQETLEFRTEALALKQRGAGKELHRQASLFMQYNCERLEALLADALRTRPLVKSNR